MARSAGTLAVHKFGGAALVDAAAIGHAAAIVARHRAGPAVIVVSAMGGVTDALLAALDDARGGRGEEAAAAAERLRARHRETVDGLGLGAGVAAALGMGVDAVFDELLGLLGRVSAGRAAPDPRLADAVVARGERVAARIMTEALRARGVDAEWVDATRVVRTDGRAGEATPDFDATAEAATAELLPLLRRGRMAVVPGFIGAGPNGELVTLGRGGSDLTATLLGRALRARTVTLWKDVPGMLTADPRLVPDARLIPRLHVREAGELAYYGARVLHPRALIALGNETRLHIRPLADPEAPGTEISTRRPGPGAAQLPVKALASIGDQAIVTITGNGMAGVPGTAARAFGALERAGVSVSLISQASSEHSICLTIPSHAAPAATAALTEAFAEQLARREVEAIDVRPNAAAIAVVGLGMAGTPGIAARLFGALAEARVNVIAVAQGASELNISVMVDAQQAAAAQRAVHAAFRLDKIGGGSAERLTHTDVVILGYGQIGRELATQLGAVPDVRVVGVIDQSGYVFDPRGLSARRLTTLAAAKRDGTRLADAPRGVKAGAAEALDTIGRHALGRPILVDATAADTGPVLEAAIAHGMDLVLANKRPLADSRGAADRLARSAAARGRRVLHEATVGAGLPIIDTLHKLHESGDQVLRIEGCPSGTLGFVFGELSRGTPFSAALRAAMGLGYTEPDPRDDLSGRDVARKALILGRLLGFEGELDDLQVESLVPPPFREVKTAEFVERLGELDAVWQRRVERARAEDKVLRYRATVTRTRVRVGVVAVTAASPLATLTGTDNQFTFTTRRYRANPLVITGPGAGAAVTAAGVLNDVLKLAGAR